MDSAVKYVHVDDASFKPALCFRGIDKAYAVIQGQDQIRTITIELRDYDRSQPVLYHGEPYNTKAYADRLLMSAKAASRPVTRRARQLLTNTQTGLSEGELVSEEPEAIEVDSIITLSDRSPAERRKDSRRPSTARDVTEAYKAAIETYTNGPVPTPTPAKGPPPVAAPRPRKGGKTATMLPPKAPAGPRKTATVPSAPVAAPEGRTRPPKAPKTATKEPAKLTVKYGGRGLVVAQLAKELGTDPKSLRVRLRAAGLKAPYTDLKVMKKALK